MNSTKQDVLRQCSFGERIAEEEIRELSSYFVQTDQWQKIYSGEIDIIYGSKGSGKSAIYGVLLGKSDELFERSILVKAAENPRGTPAFKDLVNDPPSSEEEFRALWKVYLLSLTGAVFKEYGIKNAHSKKLVAALQSADLLPADTDLSGYIRVALDFVRHLLKPESMEAGVNLDPVLQTPVGFTGKISLRAPSADEKRAGFSSIDELFKTANEALEEEDFELWLVLDRLDVAGSG